MRKAWKKAVAESKKTGKMLVVSDMMFLKENEADFDKIVTTSEKTFIDRASRRGDNTEGLSSWKSNIDKTLSAVDSNKIVETDKYFSEIQPIAQPAAGGLASLASESKGEITQNELDKINENIKKAGFKDTYSMEKFKKLSLQNQLKVRECYG